MIVLLLVVTKEAEDTSEGAIVVGGVKNEPSSRVSRKSLERRMGKEIKRRSRITDVR